MNINLIGGDKTSISVSSKSQKESEKLGSQNYEKETLKEAYHKRYKTNTSLRKWASAWLLVLIPLWLSFIAFLLLNNHDKYQLGNNVLNTLMATTTVNIIGMMYIVLKDLFAGKSEDEPQSPK